MPAGHPKRLKALLRSTRIGTIAWGRFRYTALVFIQVGPRMSTTPSAAVVLSYQTSTGRHVGLPELKKILDLMADGMSVEDISRQHGLQPESLGAALIKLAQRYMR